MKKACTERSRSGFTLIELLVAITIIGVISGVGLVSFSGIRGKTQDTVRKNDLRTLATTLELYFQKNGKYIPGTDNCLDEPTLSDGLSTYLSGNMPKDPKTNDLYCYKSNIKGTQYILTAFLDNGTEYELKSEDFIATSTALQPEPPELPGSNTIPNPLLGEKCEIYVNGNIGPFPLATVGNSYIIKGSFANFALTITSENNGISNKGNFTKDAAYILEVGQDIQTFTIKIDNGFKNCEANIRTRNYANGCLPKSTGQISVDVFQDITYNPTQTWPPPNNSTGQNKDLLTGPGLKDKAVIIKGQSCDFSFAKKTDQNRDIRQTVPSRVVTNEKVDYQIRFEEPGSFTRGMCYHATESIDAADQIAYLKDPQEPSCSSTEITDKGAYFVKFGLSQ